MPFRRTRYVEDRPLAPVLAGALRPADSIRRKMPRAGPAEAAGNLVSHGLRSNSGSLAILAAMRRASSVVNGFANDLPQEARPLALRLCCSSSRLLTKNALHVGQSLLAGTLVTGAVGVTSPRHARLDCLYNLWRYLTELRFRRCD
jgi:hypothetical protein